MALADSGTPVRCLVRDRAKGRHLEATGMELHEGDITDSESLAGAGDDVEVAYYLVHAMGGGGGYAERERIGATNFGRMAKSEGIQRFIYLGGLGGDNASEHLQSRHQTARALTVEGDTERYASSENIDRVFCKRCGTRLFAWRRNGTLAGVALATFDDRNAFVPTEHIWVSEKMGWVTIEDGMIRYDGTIPT